MTRDHYIRSPPSHEFHFRDMYKPHSVQRRRKLTPLEPTIRKSSAPVPKFQGNTTHREQFKQWSVSNVQSLSYLVDAVSACIQS